MKQTAILGAGLTGLSTAYHLHKMGYEDYQLYESSSSVGGLCRSVTTQGFTFDYTGHLLHINDPYFLQCITDIIGLDAFYSINRRSYIYSNGVYTHYPFQCNLYGLPAPVIIDCIKGYIERTPRNKDPKTFAAWVLQQFGSGMAHHFFYPYQEKIFSVPVHELSASWTNRFVPSTTLDMVLQGAFAPSEKKIGYNAHFYYPKKGGIFTWVNALAQQLKNPIALDSHAERIDIIDKKIYFTNGDTVAYDELVSTIPLDTLLGMIFGSSRSFVSQAQKKLRCNGVVNFNLGINRPQISDKHWIYFPEKQFPFYRIGFTHNFTPYSTPDQCSGLYGEFSFIKQDAITRNQRLEQAIEKTKQLFDIQDTEIIAQKIITIDHAYVIFDAWRDKNVPLLLKELETYGIYSVGRYGGWKYTSMQDNVLEGKETAETIIKKRNQNAQHTSYSSITTHSASSPFSATAQSQPNQ